MLTDWQDDGWATDMQGGTWPLGGSVMSVPPVRYSAAPDCPVDVSGIDAMAPGPALAALLAGVDPGDVSDGDLVDVIAACKRLSSWADAMQVSAMAELSRRPVFHVHHGRDEHDELRSAGCEVAAALQLAPSTGESRVWTAQRLVEEFPATLSAMLDGRVDYRRAELVADVGDHVGLAVAHNVEARVLPKAGERTIGQHRRAIERAILLDRKSVV